MGVDELTERQRAILKTLVEEYVTTATPVASENLARKSGLGVSSATIRNELVALERLNLIRQPHTSAGRVPTDEGYRVFIEALMHVTELPVVEKLTIQHQFYQIEPELGQWSQLAASVLARTVQAAAVVTAARASQTRLKHLELVWLQERRALLVLIFNDGRVRQQMVNFNEAVLADHLERLTNMLNEFYARDPRKDFEPETTEREPLLKDLIEKIDQAVSHLDEPDEAEVYQSGIKHILSQPEFSEVRQAQQVVATLEEKSRLAELLAQVRKAGGVHVIIGSENPWEEMHGCSLVFTRYGVDDAAVGLLGVMGPTRMLYPRAISGVRFLSGIMSSLMSELYQTE